MLTSSGANSAPVAVPTTAAQMVAPASAVEGRFELFRGAVSESDLLPHPAAGITSRITKAANGTKIAVVNEPGRSICVVGAFSNADVQACAPEENAATTPPIAILRSSSGKDEIAGIAPDGVKSVSITTESGEAVRVPVTGNVYSVTTTSALDRASFVRADGTSVPATK